MEHGLEFRYELSRDQGMPYASIASCLILPLGFNVVYCIKLRPCFLSCEREHKLALLLGSAYSLLSFEKFVFTKWLRLTHASQKYAIKAQNSPNLPRGVRSLFIVE